MCFVAYTILRTIYPYRFALEGTQDWKFPFVANENKNQDDDSSNFTKKTSEESLKETESIEMTNIHQQGESVASFSSTLNENGQV